MVMTVCRCYGDSASLGRMSGIRLVWDSSFGNWRQRAYTEYKAGRNPFQTEQEFEQFKEIRLQLKQHIQEKIPLKQISINSFEADDVIAAIIRKQKEKGKQSVIVIVSNDKDFYQLINKSKPVIMIKRIGRAYENKRKFSYKDFVDKYGIEPHQWSHARSLMGDSSDNIPGIMGIGEVYALELIKRYGNLGQWIDKPSLLKQGGSDRIDKLGIKACIDRKGVRKWYELIDLVNDHSGIKFSMTNNIYK